MKRPASAASKPPAGSRADHARRSGPTRRGPGGTRSARRSWWYGKGPIFRFVGLFVLYMAIFYAVTFTKQVDRVILGGYMQFYARASCVVMNLLNEGATSTGTSVVSSRYQVDIRHGCDALEPSALFISAVLAFPAPFLSKLPGLLLGTVVLGIINLVRIVSLFYTGIYAQSWFEIMHVDVWQPLFILLALFFWVVWAWWASRDRTAAATHVAA